MANSWHVEWLKEGVAKWNTRRERVDFVPDLSGLNFFEMLPPDYRDAPKTSRYFGRINLSGANMSEADLSRVNFQKANFTGANLTNANMSKSNFTEVKFIDANLMGANASQSIFDKTRFENANVQGAQFDGGEASNPILIATEFSRDQLKDLELLEVKTFASRAEYRNAIRQSAYTSRESKKSTTRKLSSREEDDRSRKNRYDVFFGTNREPEIHRGAIEGFSAIRDNKINYGLCEVIVPDGHEIGSLGSPMWKRLFNKQDDRLKIKNIISLNEEYFFLQMNSIMDQMKDRNIPTIFVHGYNNSFEDAVLRAAQIGFDLKIGQGIGLFSWPSKGTTRGYSADEAASEASKYFLADFIERFVNKIPDKSVNIIGHSMGCRCLMGALEVLAIDRKQILSAINQTILAAADVDSGVMSKLGEYAIGNSKRTTSYISDQDWALKASGWLHSFPRVGLTPPTYILSGMDTVVVNDDDLGVANHGYISSSTRVLADMFSVLKSNTPPDQRFSMEEMVAGADIYWRLKS